MECCIAQNFVLRRWYRACLRHKVVCPEMVHEFYANSTNIDFNSHTLRSTVRGINVKLSLSHISHLMGIQRVSNPQYPFNEHVGPIDSEVNRELTNDVYYLSTDVTKDLLSPSYYTLHQIV
ncbi:hypothetical protein U1Q18_038052 [Sarracenia purpurea var. burkii]